MCGHQEMGLPRNVKVVSNPLHTVSDQFQLSTSWTISFVSGRVQQRLNTRYVPSLPLRISASLGAVRRFIQEVTNVHRELAAVTARWCDVSATHIIAYLQESIDLHPS